MCNALFLWVWLGMKRTKEDHNMTDVSCVFHNLAVIREEIDGNIVLFATTTRWLHIFSTKKENDLQSARAAEPWNSPKLFLIEPFPLQYWNLQSLQAYRAGPCNASTKLQKTRFQLILPVDSQNVTNNLTDHRMHVAGPQIYQINRQNNNFQNMYAML